MLQQHEPEYTYLWGEQKQGSRTNQTRATCNMMYITQTLGDLQWAPKVIA